MQVAALLTIGDVAPLSDSHVLFGQALDRALNNRPRAWLGAEIARLCGKETPITASAVNQWVAGTSEPDRRYVFAAEQVLALKPGTLSRILGYLPLDAKPALSVLDAIEAAAELSERARRTLRSAYRELTS